MRTLQITLLLLSVLQLAACNKYLDEKPDLKLSVPTTLAELQSLLDNDNYMNNRDAAFGEISADDYYLLDADYAAQQEGFRNMYRWEKDNFYTGVLLNDWLNTYTSVYACNTVLENIEKIAVTPANETVWQNVKGQAYFFRAKRFLDAAIVYTKAYDKQTASTDPGLALRLQTDFNVASIRASNEATYRQVIADLEQAIALLPQKQVTVLRPSKPAALGLLARTYLAMNEYDSCAKYATLALQLHNTLMNFNTLNAAATFPITRLNAEVMYESMLNLQSPINATRAKVDSTLYTGYANNDKRKQVFFKASGTGMFAFKGSYEGSNSLFTGVASDELYLMQAESFARTGKVTEAMTALNTLLVTRYQTGTFVPLTASDASDAVQKILAERRKELLMRGLRWMDVKRLNKLGAGITLKRKVNNVVYILDPNSPRYALPIPDDVISITGMEQNPR